MIRKFECKNCKKRFEADDANEVVCPHCQSDNVEYATFHIPSKVWKTSGIIVLMIGVVYGLSLVSWENLFANGGKETATPPDSDTIRIVLNQQYTNETGEEIPPEIEIGSRTFEGVGYSFAATVKNLKVTDFYYAVLDPYNEQNVIVRSDDGRFKDVPYSKADGSIYTIAVFDAKTDTILCKMEQVTGFIKQKSVSKKMSVSELQAKIDKRDPSLMGVGENDYLSPNYTLTFVGLPKDAPNKPENLYDVFEKLDMETWTSVKVSSLEYDDMNRISGITLKVQESNDNF
ncbi:MAG: zinc ribbon domain-containing protein [Bacteroidaceae bacterium]|nr:zinc ribbon domain-containing protein [Bacteroidaceae bacterium]